MLSNDNVGFLFVLIKNIIGVFGVLNSSILPLLGVVPAMSLL